ncbi:MAG: aspartate 1-decarboxylase [Planctomycetota bacterium]
MAETTGRLHGEAVGLVPAAFFVAPFRGGPTGTELDYEGSIAIDRTLLEAADVLPDEQVHVLNLSNGSRIITSVVPSLSQRHHGVASGCRVSSCGVRI